MMVVPLASLAFFNIFWQHEYGLHLGLFDAIRVDEQHLDIEKH